MRITEYHSGVATIRKSAFKEAAPKLAEYEDGLCDKKGILVEEDDSACDKWTSAATRSETE